MTQDRVQNSDEDFMQIIDEVYTSCPAKIKNRLSSATPLVRSFATLFVRFSAMLFGTCRSL